MLDLNYKITATFLMSRCSQSSWRNRQSNREQCGKCLIRRMTNCFGSTGKGTTDLAEVDMWKHEKHLTEPMCVLIKLSSLSLFLASSLPPACNIYLSVFPMEASWITCPAHPLQIFHPEEPSNILQLLHCWDWQLILCIQFLLVNTPMWISGKSVFLPLKSWSFLMT